MTFEDLPSEMAALVTIERHIRTVQRFFTVITNKLNQRSMQHDLSKLNKDEFTGFVEVNQIARTHPYPSPEYTKSLKNNKTIELHFSRNSHHPEFYPNGIEDMSFCDILEMVIDWKAASETYGNTDMETVLLTQQERFDLKEKHIWLIRLILEELK